MEPKDRIHDIIYDTFEQLQKQHGWKNVQTIWDKRLHAAEIQKINQEQPELMSGRKTSIQYDETTLVLDPHPTSNLILATNQKITLKILALGYIP